MIINFKCVNKKFNNLNNFNKQIILFIKSALSVFFVLINFERNLSLVIFVTFKNASPCRWLASSNTTKYTALAVYQNFQA